MNFDLFDAMNRAVTHYHRQEDAASRACAVYLLSPGAVSSSTAYAFAWYAFDARWRANECLLTMKEVRAS